MLDEFQTLYRKFATKEIEVSNPYGVKDVTKKDIFDQYLKIRKDPLEFLKAVRTKDEVDRQNPIKAFPWKLTYLQYFVLLWHRVQFLAIPKSRRMKMSWANIALQVWDSMLFMGRDWALVSKKEDDSDQLVQRAKFIVENLDTKKFPKELIPEPAYKYCSLQFPELQSRMRGYPSGANQLRQFTFSGIMGDECAFWPDAQEMYKGAVPTTEGGGRMTLISSTAPGFFKRLVYDQLESIDDFDPESLRIGTKSPMTGVKIWTNPKNNFTVFDLHFTADPAKRSEEWKRNMKSKLPLRDWNQEYEKVWDTFVGLPVFADWNKNVHGKHDLDPQIGLPLLRGWDFGLTPACIVGQLQGDTLVILREFTELNMGADRFSDIVLPKCNLLYPGYKWIDFIDPAGAGRDQSAEGSCAKVLDSKGLNCIPGAIEWEERRKAIEKFLTQFNPKIAEPSFQIDLGNCPTLVKGFDGGYRYAESVLGREPRLVRPLKDEHSHPHDALQYLATGVLMSRKRGYSGIIPVPGYSFQGETQKGSASALKGPRYGITR